MKCKNKIYVICVCLHIVVSNTYSVVFLFLFSSSCVPCVVRFSGLSSFYCPFAVFYRLFIYTYTNLGHDLQSEISVSSIFEIPPTVLFLDTLPEASVWLILLSVFLGVMSSICSSVLLHNNKRSSKLRISSWQYCT